MLLDDIPEQWGPKMNLVDAAVTPSSTGPDTIRFTARGHYLLILMTPQPQRQVALGSDRFAQGFAPNGSVEIVPNNTDLFARWAASKETMLIGFTDERIRRLAGVEFGDDQVIWRPPKLGIMDRRALTMASQLRKEIHGNGIAKQDCVDAWVTMLGTHMLRSYSNHASRPCSSHRGGLSPRTRRRIDDYIRSHVGERMPLELLAAVAGLSPSHFSHAFRQTFGLPPHQYIIQLRLELARRLSSQSTLPFSEIARMAGFSSNSHMTLAMRRAGHTPPSELRRRPPEPSGEPLPSVYGLGTAPAEGGCCGRDVVLHQPVAPGLPER